MVAGERRWPLRLRWQGSRGVAALGACRGNCWCIGTSLDAQGFRGRVIAPGPDFSDAGSRVLRGSSMGDGALGL
jgi:hypothetical protein